MEPDDLLCSRNARPPKALVGRAQYKINQPPFLREREQARRDYLVNSAAHLLSFTIQWGIVPARARRCSLTERADRLAWVGERAQFAFSRYGNIEREETWRGAGYSGCQRLWL